MDFAALPPDINSARMYLGPGSESLIAASTAWETLASDLYSAASLYQSAVTQLTAAQWQGPSAAAMTAAASPFIQWMADAAAIADETASQAKAAAAAYEAAFAATVPPAEVAANRIMFAKLVATNLFGQNTAMIATIETHYYSMWVQDAVAMLEYSNSSASATLLQPFSSPRQTTNPNALANQTTATNRSAAMAAANTQQTLSNAFAAVPITLNGLVSSFPLISLDSASLQNIFDWLSDLISVFLDGPLDPLSAVSLPLDIIGANTGIHTDDIVTEFADRDLHPLPQSISPEPAVGGITEDDITDGGLVARKALMPRVAAGFADADTIGCLSVPPTWIASTPAVRPVALSLTLANADSDALSSILGPAMGDMALANAAGRMVGDTVGNRVRATAQAVGESRKPVMAKESAPSSDDAPPTLSEPRTVVTGIAAEIREFAKLRDDGLISEEEFQEQRSRLLGR